jgi:PEGA domain
MPLRPSARVRLCGVASVGLGITLLAIIPSTPACAQPPPPPPAAVVPPPLSPEQEAEATRLYEEGRKAATAAQWAKARDAFQRALRIKPHWQTAAALGFVDLRAGQHRDAAEHLTAGLREGSASLEEVERKELQAALAKARAKVGALTITVDPPGAEVIVNGLPVGKAPLPDAVFVDPGPVFVEARLAGYAAVREPRTAVAGKEETVRLLLRKTAEIVGPVQGPERALPVPGNQAPTSNERRVAGFAVGAVGLAGLGAGAITGVLSLVKHQEADHKCPTHIQCGSEVNDIAATGRTMWMVSTAAFGVGVLGAGLGVYLVLSSPRQRTTVGTAVLSGGGALTLGTTF